MPRQFTCQACGKTFTSVQLNAKYCSRQCSFDGRKAKRLTLTCQHCGVAFDVPQSRSDAKFCSVRCTNAAHIGHQPPNKLPPLPARSCEWCGKEFVPRWRSNPNRFCSLPCRSRFVGAANSGERNAAYKPPVIKRCERCGNEFACEPWNADKRRWCGRECTDAARREITGPDHPLYKPKVQVTCTVCGTKKMVKPSLAERTTTCSKRCAAIRSVTVQQGRGSRIEVAVAAELDRRAIRYERQRTIGHYIVDFFLPDMNLVVECDGDYWHSLAKQRRIDASKNGYMRTHGIGMARIPEHRIVSDVRSAVEDALSGHTTPPPADA